MVDDGVKNTIMKHSDFTLVVANDMLQMVDVPTEAAILSALSEKELTKSQLSRESKIPITTVAKHIQKMLDKGLVTTVNVDGRDFYTNKSRILLSTDYSRLSSQDLGKNVVVEMMGDENNDIFMYVFSWVLVELESLGTDPSFLAIEFGKIVGELFMRNNQPKNIESLLEELSAFITKRNIMSTFEVVTYLPLTFHSEYKCPFKGYPFHLTQYILVNIVKSVIEGFLKNTQYVSDIKTDIKDNGDVSMEFSVSPKYNPECDPWKVILGKRNWWME